MSREMPALIRKPCTFYAASDTIPINDLHLLCRGFFERTDVIVEANDNKVIITFPYLKAIRTLIAIVEGLDIVISKPHETLSITEFNEFERLKRKHSTLDKIPQQQQQNNKEPIKKRSRPRDSY